MTLEEAIQHCHWVAAKDCTECGKEHEQLALWLTELKSRRIAAIKELERVKLPKTNGDRIRHMTDEELVDVLRCNCCAFHNMPECGSIDCKEGHMIYLKQEVSEDAGSKTD